MMGCWDAGMMGCWDAGMTESERVRESQRESERVKESQRESKRVRESQRESQPPNQLGRRGRGQLAKQPTSQPAKLEEIPLNSMFFYVFLCFFNVFSMFSSIFNVFSMFSLGLET